MTRWSAAFRERSLPTRDTADTTDKTPTAGGRPEVVSIVSVVSAPAPGEAPGQSAGEPMGCVSSVNCVTAPMGAHAADATADPLPLAEAADLAAARATVLAGAYSDPDVQADRAAIAADAWPDDARPAATDPPSDLVERLAQAMAAPRPWQRIEGDPAPALAYFRGMARNRLDRLDGLARGLLVQAAEAEARRWEAMAVHARGTGR